MVQPRTIRGPGLFVAQFLRDRPPFDSLAGVAGWAAGLGYRALQLPVQDVRVLDLRAVAASRDRAQDVVGTLAAHGLVVSELSAHRLGYLLARHPAYALADPPEAGRDPHAFAAERLRLVARACANLDVTRCAAFSGGLAWPYVYPWPVRDPGLIETAFAEAARRWRPILDAFDAAGVDLCFEPHLGCDVHDGTTFERLREAVGRHPRCRLLYDPSHMLLQGIDHLGFIDAYASLIGAFHVKDAEFRPGPRSGAFGGFAGWIDRPGRFRSPGAGQVDFRGVFSRLARHGYDGWAVLEWEDPLEDAEEAARKGAGFIAAHIVRVAQADPDASRGPHPNDAALRHTLGLGASLS
jgi:sugar phosphate isomerase/epimerase